MIIKIIIISLTVLISGLFLQSLVHAQEISNSNHSKDIFKAKGIDLNFIRSKPIEYPQFGAEFAPMLSMIDTMMFNSLEIIQKQITQYDLV